MGRQRIISFDIDMTLLDHKDFQIPPSAMEAIQKIKEKGDIVVLATGRNLENSVSRDVVRMVDPQALIQLNGTKVTAGEQVLFEHFFDKALLKELIEFVKKKDYALGISMDDTHYFFRQDIVDYYDQKRWGKAFRSYSDPEQIINLPIRTLTFVGEPEQARDIEAHFPQIKLAMFAGLYGADVMEQVSSKANGLRVLCRHFGVDIRDTVAFGDSMNDREILEAAGLGIAMGNSIESLFPYADYITDDIGEDGVYNACVKFGLI